jgi:restriction system protein
MLEHLSSREFEEYCQVLLTCVYRCRVELTKRTGDEGRDLLVHKSSGLQVVECKHWPDGTVGRPAVQKLHSAVLTANSRQGAIITTGRFSKEAAIYARNLGNVKIELIDASKLAHMISLTFPNDALPLNLSTAIKTTPDIDFPQVFFRSVFSQSRLQSSRALITPVHVTRITDYKTFFIADYHAKGSVSTAAGEYSATWNGSVWCSAVGDKAGFGSPTSDRRKPGPVVPLADALRTVPGKSTPPRFQPYQAVAIMKDYIVSHCAKAVWYRGRNNVNYSATIQPSANKVLIDSLALVYIPRQDFVLDLEQARDSLPFA